MCEYVVWGGLAGGLLFIGVPLKFSDGRESHEAGVLTTVGFLLPPAAVSQTESAGHRVQPTVSQEHWGFEMPVRVFSQGASRLAMGQAAGCRQFRVGKAPGRVAGGGAALWLDLRGAGVQSPGTSSLDVACSPDRGTPAQSLEQILSAQWAGHPEFSPSLPDPCPLSTFWLSTHRSGLGSDGNRR